jgi:outer membrane receptor protein involved in Fe transport
VPVGARDLTASFIGYQTAVEEMAVEVGKNAKVDLYLALETLETEETVVRADSARTADKLFSKTISSVNLAPRQINQMPQVAEADLLRSLQALPGILPLSDFSSALYVRGGTPDQNLYMVDGADVYNPEHAFGIFSTFNTDAIKQVELSKGGFGAEYGGRLSSVLDVTNLDGSREQFKGTASISLLSAKTTLQMPLGNIGSLSGSLRRTYSDKTVGRSLDDIPDYYFYDGNAKAFIDLGDSDKLTLSYFGGRDFLDVTFAFYIGFWF